jgi:hypothetical protein
LRRRSQRRTDAGLAVAIAEADDFQLRRWREVVELAIAPEELALVEADLELPEGKRVGSGRDIDVGAVGGFEGLGQGSIVEVDGIAEARVERIGRGMRTAREEVGIGVDRSR